MLNLTEFPFGKTTKGIIFDNTMVHSIHTNWKKLSNALFNGFIFSFRMFVGKPPCFFFLQLQRMLFLDSVWVSEMEPFTFKSVGSVLTVLNCSPFYFLFFQSILECDILDNTFRKMEEDRMEWAVVFRSFEIWFLTFPFSYLYDTGALLLSVCLFHRWLPQYLHNFLVADQMSYNSLCIFKCYTNYRNQQHTDKEDENID